LSPLVLIAYYSKMNMAFDREVGFKVRGIRIVYSCFYFQVKHTTER